MDSSMLKKLMEKKKDKVLDPDYKNAKMGVLQALHKDMGDMMGEDVKGLKKVTVASPDKEGLSVGLEKAKELLSKGADDSDMEESEETPEIESKEEKSDAEMTPEEIDARIKELEALKTKMMKV